MYQKSQSYCSGASCSHSPSRLERIAHNQVSYQPASPEYLATAEPVMYASQLDFSNSAVSLASLFPVYTGTGAVKSVAYQHSNLGYELFSLKPEYHFEPNNFLKPGQGGKFVGEAEEIRELVEETFSKMFDLPFPDDIKISLLDWERFRKMAPTPNTVGLSLNRRELGLISEIFVLQDTWGRVLLTIGHELGHVLTITLNKQQDEEAKAYAFSLLWMKTIQEHNIAGLRNALIMEQPAENGLHNVAFRFVQRLIKEGKKAQEIYKQLVQKEISIAS